MQLTLKRQATNQVQQQGAATASDENDHIASDPFGSVHDYRFCRRWSYCPFDTD